jgi:hypothetical protein
MSRIIIRVLATVLATPLHRLSKAQSPKPHLLGIVLRLFSKKQVQREEKKRRNGVGIGRRKSQEPLPKQKTSGAQSGPRSRLLEISENGTPGMRKRDATTKRSVGVKRKDRERSRVMMRGVTNRGSKMTISTRPSEIRRDVAKLRMAMYLSHPWARTRGSCV